MEAEHYFSTRWVFLCHHVAFIELQKEHICSDYLFVDHGKCLDTGWLRKESKGGKKSEAMTKISTNRSSPRHKVLQAHHHPQLVLHGGNVWGQLCQVAQGLQGPK